MDQDLKMKNILKTLQELQCPLAGDGKDQWLEEILFNSNFQRFKLMEWILVQLGIDISELFENQNSAESKVQTLLGCFSSIGVCSIMDIDIIEGTAQLHKQLNFWEFLCTMLTKRNQLNKPSFMNSNSSDCDSEDILSKEYEGSCEYIREVCDSVNLIDCFDLKLNVFPPHLRKEVKEFFKDSADPHTSEAMGEKYFDQFSYPDLDENIVASLRQKNIEVNEFENEVILEENALSCLEKKISESLKLIENSVEEFASVHNKLKPSISNVSSEEYIDIGPAIKATHEKLNNVLKLKSSAISLKSSDTELETLSSSTSNPHVSTQCLSDNKLGEYLKILSEKRKKE